MAKTQPDIIYFDTEDFKKGWFQRIDSTKAPLGSARDMSNMRVTDRGGVAPRPGTEVLGSLDATSNGSGGLFNFRKAYDSDEFLMRTHDDKIEVYSKNHSSAGWWTLKSGLTPSKEFGFATSLVNTDNEDYVVFCNRYDEYMRWQGSVTLLNGALSGGETSVTVDSTLTDEVFESKTATSSSATTLTVSTVAWASSQWVNMYVYITSGASSGQIRKITSNTSTAITFDTLGSDPGAVAFEIRKLAFPATGSIIYNGTVVAYTGIPSSTTFTVASAHASADNVAVAIVPTSYPAAPRGNRFANFLTRIVVGNVRSALARDSGGALQGYASAGSYFVSKLLSPTDFSFTATRVAGEGDIISTPYGGGEITDVLAQEDSAYIFKPRYIESVKYSQDANDLANRTPLKAEVGSVGRVIKGSDDVYFMTHDKKFTSLGRVATKDVLPQTDNIGFNIQTVLDRYVFTTGKGIEDTDRIYIPCRSSDDVSHNDLTLVYNKVNKSFEGTWSLSANYFESFNNNLYFSDSLSPNVYQMNAGHAEVAGSTRYGISCRYASHFFNLTSSDGNTQAMNGMYAEGYIRGGSTINFKLWRDFASDPFFQTSFSGTENQFLDGSQFSASLGLTPLGINPMGTIGEVDDQGYRHFMFRIFFPYQYGNHFSYGWSSDGADNDYEITRVGLGITTSISRDANRIKNT